MRTEGDERSSQGMRGGPHPSSSSSAFASFRSVLLIIARLHAGSRSVAEEADGGPSLPLNPLTAHSEPHVCVCSNWVTVPSPNPLGSASSRAGEGGSSRACGHH